MQSSAKDCGITVKNPDVYFDDSIQRFWFQQNPVMTHGFNAFNLVIPEYERYFVRSVRHFNNNVTDPRLLEQINLFAAQEALHAKIHENYFDWMRAQGYQIDNYLSLLARYARISERFNTPKYNLASTAAAEHFTATIGLLFLTETELSNQLHPMMRRFLTWHSVEELEHKAVAYNVLKATKVGYWLRIFTFTLTLLEMFVWINSAIYMLAKQDKLSLWKMYKFKRQHKKQIKGLSWRFMKILFAYYRPGFHPDNMQVNIDLQLQLKNTEVPTS